MISVLCPTRLRLEALLRSMASLSETATGDIEFLLAVDEDDPSDYDWLNAIVVPGPRHGYAQLHRYYNELAGWAEGDWLLLWNDDALMVTAGWDEIVHSHSPDVVLSPSTVHNPLCTFPIVPRRFVEAIGHFSLNAHCDTWWQEIAEELGVLCWPPIRVEHDRADLTGRNDDSVFRERQYQTGEFNALRSRRLVDAELIRAALAVAS